MTFPRWSLVVLATAIGACGGGGGGGEGSSDAGPDGSGGVGCEATSPRSSAPELFIGPDGLEERMVDLIDGATDSIDLQMYVFTTDSIADAVVEAHQRGVAVRVLFDPEHAGNAQVRARFDSADVPNRNNSTDYPFSHAKYLILDGDTAVIMSSNFNYSSMANERNYGILDRDADDIVDLQAVFDADWNDQAQPDLSCTRLVVSPINARRRVVELVESADATLELEVSYLSESTVRDAVIAAHGRGVAVRVLLGDPAAYDDNDLVAGLLQENGVPVRMALAIDVHAKLIIADGVAFVGSQNMSYSALTQNREVGAMVFEPGPAAMIKAQFESDWAQGSAP